MNRQFMEKALKIANKYVARIPTHGDSWQMASLHVGGTPAHASCGETGAGRSHAGLGCTGPRALRSNWLLLVSLRGSSCVVL